MVVVGRQPCVPRGAGVPTEPTVSDAGGGAALALWVVEQSAWAIPTVSRVATPNSVATTERAP